MGSRAPPDPLSPAPFVTRAGIEAADSVAWNPHKMMGLPMQCSAFLTRSADLRECNGLGAEYLFQPDKYYGDLDIGDKTLVCGRRAEALKLWMAWKRVGDQGWEQRVDHAVELAEGVAEFVR